MPGLPWAVPPLARRSLHSTLPEPWTRVVSAVGLTLLLSSLPFMEGCSLKHMAMNSLANSLSSGGSSVYLTDSDPILVGDALPFSLKLMETVLQETPDHEGLLVATASAFAMYSHAFVLREARVRETHDPVGAQAGLSRAKALFLRGRMYAGRALEVRHPGILRALPGAPEAAAARLNREDVPAMYWYAASHGAAVSADKGDMDLVADFPVVPALLRRAEDLDEAWSSGAIHELLVVVSASEGAGGLAEAEHHFQRAMELNQGKSIAPLVSFAETVCVQTQDRERFEQMLQEALVFDLGSAPEFMLSNTLARSHALWILGRADDLFIQDSDPSREEANGLGGDARWPIRT